MTVVTGILFVVPRVSVTGFAAYTVIAVESEISVVVECCRFPSAGAMAASTACLRLPVKIVGRFISLVATDACFSR